MAGNSGYGKSTLLRCLNGLIPAVTEGKLSGQLFINGRSYSQMKMHKLNCMIGSVFQNPRSQFFTDNTTSKLVFPMENYGWSKTSMKNKPDGLVEIFGHEGLMNKNIHILSSGERLQIEMAMLCERNLIIFDEPTSGLDVISMEKVSSTSKTSKNLHATE